MHSIAAIKRQFAFCLECIDYIPNDKAYGYTICLLPGYRFDVGEHVRIEYTLFDVVNSLLQVRKEL